jgi:hypothetical protein
MTIIDNTQKEVRGSAKYIEGIENLMIHQIIWFQSSKCN